MRNHYKRIDEIIEREGGYVDHPADKGGPTNYGITIGKLSEWLGREATRQDVRGLDRGEAVKIYWRDFIRNPGFDLIHVDSIADHVVDCGVLHHPKPATRWLQKAVSVKPDGVIGPITLKAVNEGTFLPEEINRSIMHQRIRFMVKIVQRDSSQLVFLAGWINRALSFDGSPEIKPTHASGILSWVKRFTAR